ncbi:putative alpha-galactosidase, protein [Acrodontium crateriforme]|uniref:Alpha-galactosidase n=1 Tax=Acrodontium crateriforme TaxID=150365 RepID=A0AAQ3M4E7_9PEZI|nr:putative alpha-galactosidase, protein [Acrodontium crateriforme]
MFAIFIFLYGALALDNGYGKTPFMGYNTYNAAACTINETWVKDSIQRFHDQGFLTAGYRNFGIDCGWQGARQSNGSIGWDKVGFPHGIAAISQSARSKGFNFGIYTDQGIYSCDTGVQRPGSLGHEAQDAAQFAGWNVAYVDNCFVDGTSNAPKDARTDFPSRFGTMGKALASVGIKGMLTCQWGVPYASPTGLQGPAEWTSQISTSYRVSDDIATGWNNVMRIMNQAINVNLRGLSSPGSFADMDLLEVGNSGMTTDEQASHFAIWAMFKSSLVVSTRLSSLSSTAKTVLQNVDLIAVNQDPLGKPVLLRHRFTGDNDQFSGPLSNGDIAVLLLDQSNTNRNLGINFADYNISTASVKNLWTGESLKNADKYFTNVNAHGALPLRLSNIVYASPHSISIKYFEAEQGKLGGAANIQTCSGCSGGYKVGYIGEGAGNTLTFTDIETSQSVQDVRFDYINGEVGYLGGGNNVRSASISVNGQAAVTVDFPLSGYNWDVNVARSFLVRLYGFKTDGTNTITIAGTSSESTYAPDIDRIGIVL